MNEYDVKMGRVIRNGFLICILGALAIMASCSVASWHYDHKRLELEQTRYLVTRPW